MNQFTLQSWLESFGCSNFYNHFKTRGYDNLQKCCNIGNDDLNVMGIQQRSARIAIIAASCRLHQQLSQGITNQPPMAKAESDDDFVDTSRNRYGQTANDGYYYEIENEEDTQDSSFPSSPTRFHPHRHHHRHSDHPSANPTDSTAARFRATSFTAAVDNPINQSNSVIPLHLQNGACRQLKRYSPLELKMILRDKLIEDGVDLTRQPYNAEDSDRLSELALNYSDTLDASALEILQQLQSLRVRGIKQNIKSKVVSPIANRAESEKDNRNDIYLERREETSAVPKRPSQDNNAALGQIQDGRPKTGKTWKRNLSLKMSNLKKDIKEATSTKLRSTLNLSLRRKSTGEMDSDTGTEVDRMEENYRKEHIRRDSSSTESVIRRRSRRDSSPTDSAARKAYSPSPTIGKSLSQSDRLKLLKAVRDKKMSMETAIKLAEELDNTEAENNARLSGYSQNEESGGNRNLHLRDNEDDVDDSMKITVMPPVRRSLSSHNLRHRSPPRSDLNMKRYSMINDLSSGNAAPASRKERPKSEYRRSNIDVMVYQKLSNEGIDLTVHPYTDKNGANIVAYDLIGRFAEDLGVSSTKITLAIDRIRVQELQRLNLHAIPLQRL